MNQRIGVERSSNDQQFLNFRRITIRHVENINQRWRDLCFRVAFLRKNGVPHYNFHTVAIPEFMHSMFAIERTVDLDEKFLDRLGAFYACSAKNHLCFRCEAFKPRAEFQAVYFFI